MDKNVKPIHTQKRQNPCLNCAFVCDRVYFSRWRNTVCSAATNRKTLIKTSLRRGFLFSGLPKKRCLLTYWQWMRLACGIL